jgi:hypothetical protein
MPPLVPGSSPAPPTTLWHRCFPLRLAPTSRSPSPGGKRQQELVNRARSDDAPQGTSSLLISEPSGPYHAAPAPHRPGRRPERRWSPPTEAALPGVLRLPPTGAASRTSHAWSAATLGAGSTHRRSAIRPSCATGRMNRGRARRPAKPDLTALTHFPKTLAAPITRSGAARTVSLTVRLADRTAGLCAFSLTFSVTQRDAICRRRPLPNVQAARRDPVWRSPSDEVPVDATERRTNGPAVDSWIAPDLGHALCGRSVHP